MARLFTFVFLSILAGCSLAPEFTLPEMPLPSTFKEQPVDTATGKWAAATPMEQADRGQWWKIFGDATLNDLQKQASEANASLQIAVARATQARALAESKTYSFLPDISIGGNAVRAKPASAANAAFGGNTSTVLKPYTLYSAQGVASYELDLFGRVRDNYHALEKDADAADASYRSTLLLLQADVAQYYFTLRALDAERQLLRDTVAVREEAMRIMQSRFTQGDVGEQDLSRTQSELASVKADLLAADRTRATTEHALAVLLGKIPSGFSFAQSPLAGLPPSIPAGLPSRLLERRPDIAAAISAMAAANDRIGVARTAFFPRIELTAGGGYESTNIGDLFQWSSRSWSLGQLAGNAITMPIFDSGRNLARLDQAKATHEETVAAYRQQVLIAFRDVEDTLAGQRLLAAQSEQQEIAAAAANRTTELTQKRYERGDADYFEVVNAQRDSLLANRLAMQTRGQRFVAAVTLIRALGGGWDELKPETGDTAMTKPATLTLTSTSLQSGKPIAEKYAYCTPDGKGQTKNGGNISPQLSWQGAPEGTKSYVLIVVDPDVPTDFTNANKGGKTLAADMPRQNFYHWILTDIPASITSLAEGQDSAKFLEGGKPVGKTAYGINAANDYSKFYKGPYGGYDGPCPPWNDMRLHHYHFIVYALDVETLGLSAPTGKQVEEAMANHILAKGELVGTYTNNPAITF